MKKTMKTILVTVMTLSMVLCFAACGGSAKKQEAIDAFNATSTDYDEVVNLVNANADVLDDELISTFQDMSEVLTQYKGILESDDVLEDDKYDEMITWLNDVKDWTADAKAEIENAIAQ